jgi:RNA polymerase sigma-70 factor (ECF subfamily)
MKRSQGAFSTGIDLSEWDTPDGDDVEQSVINRDLKELITALTHDLTPKQRLVFTLRDIEGLELEEVREITGMSGAKIKSNLYLARQYIRNKISEA